MERDGGVCVLEGGYAVGSEAFCQPLTEAIAVKKKEWMVGGRWRGRVVAG